MPEVRILGGIVGVAAVILGIVGLRHHRTAGILRIRDVVVILVGVGLLALAIFPRWFDSAAGAFGVSSLEGKRIAILTVVGFTALAIALFASIGRVGSLETDIGNLALEVASRLPAYERLSVYPTGFIAAVIPAYNEEASLPDVLSAMPETVDGVPVISIVVSDGSTDGTAGVAADRADVVLVLPLQRGSGAAVRTGIAFALERGATVLVTLDADGQHDPGEMRSVAGPVLIGEADLCQGSRIVNSRGVSGHSVRVAGVSIFGWMMRTTGVADTTDPSNGYRAISAVAYRDLALTEDQFYVGELIVRSSRAGLRIREVPVTVSPRSHGETKKPGTLLYGFGFTRGIIRAMTRSTPRR